MVLGGQPRTLKSQASCSLPPSLLRQGCALSKVPSPWFMPSLPVPGLCPGELVLTGTQQELALEKDDEQRSASGAKCSPPVGHGPDPQP